MLITIIESFTILIQHYFLMHISRLWETIISILLLKLQQHFRQDIKKKVFSRITRLL